MKRSDIPKKGFYLEVGIVNRCYYSSGTTTGNKWIDLDADNSEWVGLMWWALDEIVGTTYYDHNPIPHKKF